MSSEFTRRELKLISAGALVGAFIALFVFWGIGALAHSDESRDGFELLGKVPLGSQFGYEYQPVEDEKPVEQEAVKKSPAQVLGKVAGAEQSASPLFGIFAAEKENEVEKKISEPQAKVTKKEKTVSAKQEEEKIFESSCSYTDGSESGQKTVIFNEINWMGSAQSSNHEWIELKNISQGEIDLSGWLIVDLKEQIRFTILQGLKLPANAFYVVKRGEDMLPDLNAPSYVGALSNSNEGLKLFNSNCGLEDFVEAVPSWPAGESSERKSMERAADLSWYTNTGASGSSPGKNNSPEPVATEEDEEESVETEEEELIDTEDEEVAEEETPPVEEEEPAENSDGRWYTSSYPTAKYYYCEQSSGWESLSKNNLRSFDSEEDLLAEFPTRTLHTSCQ
ncbi:MAG: lamin tail domain-containing protein [Candidatus Harrisonbacteria bacterium]|nr:lamin tail domain-containing protein [Candidatus Harrisonbacteria bacterium]